MLDMLNTKYKDILNSLFEEGRKEGLSEGRTTSQAATLLRLFARRFGYENAALTARVSVETRNDLLESWFDELAMLQDAASMLRLADQIIATPPPPKSFA